jgi:multisubunit Na+/H+ antiporter MnhB subunit
MIVAIAVVVFLLSFRLKPVEQYRELSIDWVGAVLAALAVILISIEILRLNLKRPMPKDDLPDGVPSPQ